MPFTPDQALAYAQASQRIDGREMSPYAVAVARRMLAGEITLDEARELILAEALSKVSSIEKPDDRKC